jgi:hypothetical protein
MHPVGSEEEVDKVFLPCVNFRSLGCTETEVSPTVTEGGISEILIVQILGHNKSGRMSIKRANIDQPLRHLISKGFALRVFQLAVIEPRLQSIDFVGSRCGSSSPDRLTCTKGWRDIMSISAK